MEFICHLKRSVNWIKLKKDYLQGVGDTLDLIVMGVYFGKGKRAGVFGGFLLGSYNDKTCKIESICKIGSGFDEEFLKNFYENVKEKLIDKMPNNYASTNITPDKWINSEYVWEIKCAELSLSPIYDAGKTILKKKSISLRFPRFIKVRDDKNIEDSTNSQNIVDLYNSVNENK